jgi:hypothetical protein
MNQEIKSALSASNDIRASARELAANRRGQTVAGVMSEAVARNDGLPVLRTMLVRPKWVNNTSFVISALGPLISQQRPHS